MLAKWWSLASTERAATTKLLANACAVRIFRRCHAPLVTNQSDISNSRQDCCCSGLGKAHKVASAARSRDYRIGNPGIACAPTTSLLMLQPLPSYERPPRPSSQHRLDFARLDSRRCATGSAETRPTDPKELPRKRTICRRRTITRLEKSLRANDLLFAVWSDSPASYQANADAAGNNIVGDAANEPSIAADPTDSNKRSRLAGGSLTTVGLIELSRPRRWGCHSGRRSPLDVPGQGVLTTRRVFPQRSQF